MMDCAADVHSVNPVRVSSDTTTVPAMPVCPGTVHT